MTRLRVGQLWSQIPAGSRDFCILHTVQTVSLAHTASYPMGPVTISLWLSDCGVKLTSHLHTVSELRMGGALSLLLYALIGWTYTTLTCRVMLGR